MNIEQLEKQQEVVLHIAQLITESWRRIVVSYEVEDTQESTEHSTMVVYVTGPTSDLRLGSVDKAAPEECGRD